MEFKKILLLGLWFLSVKSGLFAAQSVSADEGGATYEVQKMLTLRTSDHTEKNPQLFQMTLDQAKRIGVVKNLLEDIEEEDCGTSILFPNIDSETFKIIKQWIEKLGYEVPYNEETKAQAKSSLQKLIGVLEAQALFDKLLRIGQAVDLLDLHIFDGEVEDVSINGVPKEVSNEWTGALVAELLVDFLNDNSDAFLNGKLQFPQETQDEGGFLGKLVKENLIKNIIKGQVLKGHEGLINELLVGLDGTLYSGSGDGTIRVWKKGVDGKYQEVQVLEVDGGLITTFLVGLDGTFYSGSRDGKICVWTRGTDGYLQKAQVLGRHEDAITALLVGPDGILYSGSDDATIRVWERDRYGQYREVQALEGHEDLISALLVGSDGRLYSGSNDSTIRVWERDRYGQYREVQALEGHEDAITALIVAQNGRIYSGSWDGSMRVWTKVEGDYRSQVLQGHQDSITALVVESDGTLYSGSGDSTIRVWTSGRDDQYREMQVLKGHQGSISVFKIGPDGRIYSGSGDSTIRVWTRGRDDQYREMQALRGHQDSISALAVGSNGLFCSGSWDNFIRLWNLWILQYKDGLDWKQSAVLMFVDKAQRVPQQEEGAQEGYNTAREIYDAIPKVIRRDFEKVYGL